MNVENVRNNKASGGWSSRRIITAAILVAGVLLAYLYGNNLSSSDKSGKVPTQSHNIGETFSVEGVQFVVSDVSKSSEQDLDIITVSYSAQNNSKKEVTIGSNSVKIIDIQNREFESRISLDAPGSLNPGIKKSGKAEFEVPKDATDLRIAIRTDMVDFGGADYSYVRVP